jgi:hypothetical protein
LIDTLSTERRPAAKPDDLILAERVEWLERQVAELKERP